MTQAISAGPLVPVYVVTFAGRKYKTVSLRRLAALITVMSEVTLPVDPPEVYTLPVPKHRLAEHDLC